MTTTDALLVCADAVAVALLVRGGAAKLVAPSLAAAAAGELRPGRGPVPAAVIRALAVVEITVAVAMALPSLRGPVHVPLAALGVLFAGAGILGLLRGSTEPCGCFGADSTSPLGVSNVVMGVAILAAAVSSLWVHGVGTSQTGSASAGVAGLGAIVTGGWLLHSHRKRAYTVLGNLLKQPEPAA
ncbi:MULTISPECIES: MauE/DoxX family redox-associated membrane protein [Streptomyces]|uniref:MauE/DoxX family redox-associated membrane protein n=1 Tax=Streptomyces TaxID=1883 RepID=UPI000CF2ECA6|nr:MULTISPECIES: MauE/DoxX family redox-associated membrane protein [Streptomyces]